MVNFTEYAHEGAERGGHTNTKEKKEKANTADNRADFSKKIEYWEKNGKVRLDATAETPPLF